MDTIKRQARVAGWLYLVLLVTGPIGLVLVPHALFVPGNAGATGDHIRTAESLLRFGIASELLGQTVQVFLLVALYRLFRRVDEQRAALLVILGALVSVPIEFVNVLNEIAALFCTTVPALQAAFPKTQLDALAYLFFRLHGQGLNVASVFWGLWLFPFAMLVIRSRFIPARLGVPLMLAGAGYLLSAAATLLLPAQAGAVGQVTMVLELGEVPIIFWLAIWGARPPQAAAAPVPA